MKQLNHNNREKMKLSKEQGGFNLRDENVLITLSSWIKYKQAELGRLKEDIKEREKIVVEAERILAERASGGSNTGN